MCTDELIAWTSEPDAPAHAANWIAGWGLVLAGLSSGAVLGLGFHRPEFLGGYGSLKRRLLRLGHIACVALGMLNLLYALSPWPTAGTLAGTAASGAWIAGGLAMPLCCALVAFRPRWRHVFALPVVLLIFACTACLAGMPH